MLPSVMRFLAVAGLLLGAGCTTPDWAEGDPTHWDVSGHVSASGERLTLYINDEQAVSGELNLAEGFKPFGTAVGRAPGEEAGGESYPFFLDGQYRGREVVARCGQLPPGELPFCQVYVDQRLVETLAFAVREGEGGFWAD